MNPDVPVNMYQQDDRIMIAAPLPGMEPANIRIDVDGRRVRIATEQRGPGQDTGPQYLQKEWTAGPYRREVQLPSGVDVSRANATYDNGVLVLILPVSDRETSGPVVMEKVGTSKGQTVGHAGRDLHSR